MKQWVSVIIPAAGDGKRFLSHGSTGLKSKLLAPLGRKTILYHALSSFTSCRQVREVIIAAKASLKHDIHAAAHDVLPARIKSKVVHGGKSRAESVFFALKYVSRSATHVMVHDGARPFVKSEWIKSLLHSIGDSDGVVLGRQATSTVKRYDSKTGDIIETLRRSDLFEAETPQLFHKKSLMSAYQLLGKHALTATDDASIVELAGGTVRAVIHEGNNMKITRPTDLNIARSAAGEDLYRFGLGTDMHRLVTGRAFLLGGIRIKSNVGTLGHSDGDPLLHAIIDGILGAAGMGDIGELFPDSSVRHKNESSKTFLRDVIKRIQKQNLHVDQVDATVFLERPRLGKMKMRIRSSISKMLNLPIDRVNLKAKTGEGLDSIGRGEAVSAQALVVLRSGSTS